MLYPSIFIIFLATGAPDLSQGGIPELTSYREILPFLQIFTSNVTGNYSALISDPNTNSLLVGAKDRLIRLNADTMTELEHVEIPSKPRILNNCLKIRDDKIREECHNYIKIIHRVGDRIFVCGTNSFDPICWWRQLNNIHQSVEEMDGKGRAPYALNVGSTSTFTSDGNYYVGTWLDTTGQDSVFYRSLGDSPFLRTLQANENWLKGAEFVATYEIGEFVYFFFREIANEDSQLGDVQYSRVARVCKNDRGGNFVYDNVWITYRKARLTCALKKPVVRTFDILRAVHYDRPSHTFIMAFNSASGTDSALCAYDLSAIEVVFNGPFKYYVSDHDIFVSKANPYASTNLCQARQAAFNSSLLYENMITTAATYQLMYEPVVSIYHGPIYHQTGTSLTHMIAQVINTNEGKNKTYKIYAMSEGGIMDKIHYVWGSERACLVEKIYINEGSVAGLTQTSQSQNRIRDLQFSEDNTAIYVLRDEDVLKVHLLRCERHKTGQNCQKSMDAYCGWDSIYNQCSPRPTVHSNLQYWRANSVSCQSIDSMPSEVYSDWTDWSSCDVTGAWRYGDNCLCRNRACLKSNCTGSTVQISNCTTHGGWTKWSQWSACSHSCGFALRYRERSCTNPTPRFGGRSCLGKSRDEEFCGENPPCPEIKPDPVHGGWSDWGKWSTCSRKCGIGTQNKSRSCNEPQPQFGGSHCQGCDVQHRLCNTHTCRGTIKESNWTEWYILNFTMNNHNNDLLNNHEFHDEGKNEPVRWYSETRLKFGCRTAPRANQADQLIMKPLISESRICSTEGHDSCTKISNRGTDPNAWSPWSEWSDCSVTCGQGTQYRNRTCDSYKTLSCTGVPSQSRSCFSNTSCAPGDGIGWEPWSPWTQCDTNNEESRFRICKTRNPGLQECLGLNVERRSCKFSNLISMDDSHLAETNPNSHSDQDPIKDNSLLAQYMVWKQRRDSDFYDDPGVVGSRSPVSLYQLVTGCVVAFLCGILVTGALFAAWYRRKFRDCLLRQQKNLFFQHRNNPFDQLNRQNSLLAPLKNGLTTSTILPPSPNNQMVEKDILFGAPFTNIDGCHREATLLRIPNGTTLKATNSFKTTRPPHYDHVNHYYQIHHSHAAPAYNGCSRGSNDEPPDSINHQNYDMSSGVTDEFTLIPPGCSLEPNFDYNNGKGGCYLGTNTFYNKPNYNTATLIRGSKHHLATLHNTINKTTILGNTAYGLGLRQTGEVVGNATYNEDNPYGRKNTNNTTRANAHHNNQKRYNAYSSLPRLKKEASFKESTIKRDELFPPHVYDDPF